MEILKYFTNNAFHESAATEFYDVYNPSTGELIAKSPKMPLEEVQAVINNAAEAYKTWSRVPVIKRVQILYKVRELLVEHMDELTYLCAKEHGKVWNEAQGDILKAKVVVKSLARLS